MEIEKPIKKTSLESFRKNLPIFNYRSDLIQKIKSSNNVLIIAGETGCGKTTQIPQYIFEENLHKNMMVAITQPRRVAAITVSSRVAEEKNSKVGELVGYSIRFEEKLDPIKTKIKFLTDGMLLRECILDPLLKKYSVIIVDEAHERTLHSDLLLGLLKSLMTIRNDVKIIIMSATIELEKFTNFFPRNDIFPIEGRFFPIGIYYVKSPVPDYLDSILNTILQIHFEEQEGDILAFLTGQEDIEDLEGYLQEKIELFPPDSLPIQICPLYSALPSKDQLKAFEKKNEENRKTRKIILATNIAETSVTIDGIKFVIDGGLVKERRYNPGKDLETLCVVPISKSSALQRAGRAGRQSEGKCFRLYTKETYENLSQYSTPEILRTNLCHSILQMKAIGIKDIKEFDFIDKPKEQSITKSIETLKILGALSDPEEELTSLGSRMSTLPLDPLLSFLLLRSLLPSSSSYSSLLLIISSLSVENFFYFPKGQKAAFYPILSKFSFPSSDHLTKAGILRGFMRARNRKSFCKENFLNKKSMKKVLQVIEQLRGYMGEEGKKAEDEEEKRKNERGGGNEGTRGNMNSQSSLSLIPNGLKGKGEQIGGERVLGGGVERGNESKGQEEIGEVSGVTENDEKERVLKCLAEGMFLRSARLNNDGRTYTLQNTGQTAQIHPESVCFYLKKKPEFIIYNEVVITKKTYLRNVTEIPAVYFKEFIQK